MRYRNAMQRDPNLAKAFDNLAGLFAPPSGSDYLASAKMQSERADAERRAMIFSHQDPAVAAELAARMGIANYGQTQSGFGKTDATNRRGQDIERSTKLDQTRMQQEGELARLYATPRTVGQGQTLLVPEQTQRATGFGPTMMGIQERDPGKAYVLPDGTTAMGPAPTLSLDQRKGEVFATLPQEQQQAAAFGNTPVETVIMDGQPRIVARRDAIGQTPVPPAGQTPKAFVAQLADGRQVPAVQRPDGSFAHAQTGERLPDDLKPFNLPTPTGKNEDVGLGTTANLTEANRVAANIATTRSLLDLYANTISKNPGAIGIVGAIRGTAQNLIASGNDFARAFGNNVPQVQAAQEQIRSELQRLTGVNFFDPSIPEAEFIQHTLAYALARSEGGGGGQISNLDFRSALDRVKGGGLLANSDSALAAIGAARKTLDAQEIRAQRLRNSGSAGAPGAPATPAAPAREERWERGPDGNLGRAQ